MRRRAQSRRAADPVAQLALELGAEFGVTEPAAHAALEPLVRRNKGFRHVAPAKRTVTPALVRKASGQQIRERVSALSFGFYWTHAPSLNAARAA